MADDHEIQSLWKKHDELRKDMTDVQVVTAVQGKQIEQQLVMLNEMNSRFGERHGEITTSLNDISTSLKTLDDDYHERQGSEKTSKYQTWLFFSLMTAIFSAITYFTS